MVANIDLISNLISTRGATMKEPQKPEAHVEIAIFLSLVALVVIITLLASNVSLPV